MSASRHDPLGTDPPCEWFQYAAVPNMRGTMTVAKIWIPYCGAAPAPAELLARWNLDPLLIAAIALGAVAYRRYAQDSRRNRIAFAGLIATLLALFISPFCALSSALFSARVTHHVLLAVLAAPLLVAALPTFRPRLPLAFWTAAQTLIFWLWHAPGIYAWALSSDAAYWLMQLSLLASAALFWSSVRAASAPAAVAALLATMVQMGLLGALITFSVAPLYAPHFLTTTAWGLSPLDDQQLAGLIMWAPGAAAYLGAALLLIGRFLGPDHHAPAAAQ